MYWPRRGPGSRERGTVAPLFSAHVYCGHRRPSQLAAELLLHSLRQIVGCIGATWRIRLELCTLTPPGEYHLTRASFGPTESTTQTANRSVQPFLYSSRWKIPILYNGQGRTTLSQEVKNCPFSWASFMIPWAIKYQLHDLPR